MEKSKNIAIVILAAGSSSRMGNITKQLIKYKDESFLRISVKKALNLSNNVYVILGHDYDKCKEELREFNINIVKNDDYIDGLSTSLKKAIEATKDYERTLIILCDQPFIPQNHLKNLIDFDTKKIVATKYKGIEGFNVPAIFPNRYYNEILKLQGDKGAKSILNSNDIDFIELEKSFCIDIDTIDDVAKFLN